MVIHHNVEHFQRPLHTEMIRAHNAGRTRDEKACREMLQRLDAIQKLPDTDPTFVLVSGQAKALLHSIWELRSPSRAGAVGDLGD